MPPGVYLDPAGTGVSYRDVGPNGQYFAADGVWRDRITGEPDTSPSRNQRPPPPAGLARPTTVPEAPPPAPSTPGIMTPAEMAGLRTEILGAVRPAMTGTTDPITAESLSALRAPLGGAVNPTSIQALNALTPTLTGAIDPTTAEGLSGLRPMLSGTLDPTTAEGLAAMRATLNGTVDPTSAAALNAMRGTLDGTSAQQMALSPYMTGAPGSSPMTDAAIAAFQSKTAPLIQQQMLLKGLGRSPAVSQATGSALAEALPQFINFDSQNRLRAAELYGGQQQTAANMFGQIGGRTTDQAQTAANMFGQAGGQARQQQLAAGNTFANTGGRLTDQALAAGNLFNQTGDATANRALTAGTTLANVGGRTVDQGQAASGLAANVLSGEANFGLKGTELAANIANAESMRQLEAFRSAGQLQLGLADSQYKAAQLQQNQQQLALQAGQAAGGLQRDVTQGVADAYQAEILRLQGLAEGGSFGVFGGSPLQPQQKTTTQQSGSSK